MVQVTESVGTVQNGSIKAVTGSGIASMSDASMDFQPRIDEPSKPKPSPKTSSVNSATGTLKCCQVPKVSTNLTSTILAPCLRAMSITLRAEAEAPAPLACLAGFVKVILVPAPGAAAKREPLLASLTLACFGIIVCFFVSWEKNAALNGAIETQRSRLSAVCYAP